MFRSTGSKDNVVKTASHTINFGIRDILYNKIRMTTDHLVSDPLVSDDF